VYQHFEPLIGRVGSLGKPDPLQEGYLRVAAVHPFIPLSFSQKSLETTSYKIIQSQYVDVLGSEK
jgi:hypothetical protein